MHSSLKEFFTKHVHAKPALYSWPFIVSLFLLLVNDFILKAAFSNTFTGKLSDFCGLYAFAFFFSNVFPQNKKFAVHIITALLFIVWKSPLSESFIVLFSTYVFTIDRVVDYSDLWALLVLPVSYFINAKPFDSFYKTIVLSLVALIAFTATSQPRPTWHFFEPQYLLFKNTIPINEAMTNVSKIGDSLILVEITQVSLNHYPEYYDDFQQKAILEQLDKSIFCEDILLRDSLNALVYRPDILSPYYCKEEINIGIGLEKVSFLNGRLHGAYIRYKDSQKTVSGYYNKGIPDSTWTYYANSGCVDKEDFYSNGEKVKSIDYEQGQLKSRNFILTRQNKITIGYISFIVIIFVFVSAVYFLLNEYKKETKKISILQTLFYSILSSIISIGTTSILLFTVSTDFLQVVSIQLLFLIFSCPLFFIIYLAIDRHNIKTFLLIILLYTMVIIMLHNMIIISDLKSVSEIDFSDF